MKYLGPEPDFIGAISPGAADDFHDGVPLKESVFMDNWPSFNRLRSLFNFPSQLKSADGWDTVGLMAKQLCDCLRRFPGFFMRE